MGELHEAYVTPRQPLASTAGFREAPNCFGQMSRLKLSGSGKEELHHPFLIVYFRKEYFHNTLPTRTLPHLVCLTFSGANAVGVGHEPCLKRLLCSQLQLESSSTIVLQ